MPSPARWVTCDCNAAGTVTTLAGGHSVPCGRPTPTLRGMVSGAPVSAFVTLASVTVTGPLVVSVNA